MLKKIVSLKKNPVSNEPEADRLLIKNVVRSVRLASFYVPAATCLVQALATRTVLQIKGQQSSIRIGVGRDEKSNFVAHAWVEAGGKIIIGKSGDMYRYSPMSDARR